MPVILNRHSRASSRQDPADYRNRRPERRHPWAVQPFFASSRVAVVSTGVQLVNDGKVFQCQVVKILSTFFKGGENPGVEVV